MTAVPPSAAASALEFQARRPRARPSPRPAASPRPRPPSGGDPAGASAARAADAGRFLALDSCCALRAVVVSGLSDARSSQNWSSLTPPKDSAGHISSSMSAPLRKPTRRRDLAVLAVGPVTPRPARAAIRPSGRPALASSSSIPASSGPVRPAQAAPGVASWFPAPNTGAASVGAEADSGRARRPAGAGARPLSSP
jgi:hypothetical protein